MKTTLVILLSIALIGSLAIFAGADEPLRLVSHLPSLTEILFAMGLGNFVVGVSDFCNYPPQTQNIPRVGGIVNVNYEAVIALHPSLVLLDAKMKDQIDKYDKLNIKTLPTQNNNVEQVFLTISAIGRATGKNVEAQQLVYQIKDELAALKKQYGGGNPVKTLLVVGHDPGALRSIYVASNGSFLGDLLEIAGGENVIAAKSNSYPAISKEFIIKSDPDCILVFEPEGDDSPKAVNRERALWKSLGSVKAVQTGRIYRITHPASQKPGPRMPVLVKIMAQKIHQQP